MIMKNKISLFVFFILISGINFSYSQSGKDIYTTCQVLCELTGKAITNKNIVLITSYYNTFTAIKSDNIVDDEHDSYFKSIREKYISKIKIPSNTLLTSTRGQTINHHTLEPEFSKALKDLDINSNDIELLKAMKKLKDKNIDFEKLKKLDSKILEKAIVE